LSVARVVKSLSLFPLRQHTAMTKTKKPAAARLTPAQVVVKTFEGVRATARILNLSAGAVSRWQTLRGGRVPSRHHVNLLEAARKRRKKLSPADLVLGRG
jgi:hypothetical protein